MTFCMAKSAVMQPTRTPLSLACVGVCERKRGVRTVSDTTPSSVVDLGCAVARGRRDARQVGVVDPLAAVGIFDAVVDRRRCRRFGLWLCRGGLGRLDGANRLELGIVTVVVVAIVAIVAIAAVVVVDLNLLYIF